MKTDPSRPIYEPRNVKVRRELFRFADQHHIALSGEHHPINPHPDFGVTDLHWTWLFSARWAEDVHYQVPVSELLSLIHELYPGKVVRMHVPEGELGIDAIYVMVPAISQRREAR